MTKTYYDILGIEHDVDQATIRKAYLKLSLKYHPDKNPSNVIEAKEKFIEIGQAYEILSDPMKRSDYDRNLKYGAAKSASYCNEIPKKSYESYREAFDDHVAHMSEDEFRAAVGAASVIGSIIGSMVGSSLGRKLGGNSSIGNKIFQTAGSLVGSSIGSEAGSDLFKNIHIQSRERISFDERRKIAHERGDTLPEPPKEGWGDLYKPIQKTAQKMTANLNARATLTASATKSVLDAARAIRKETKSASSSTVYRM